ncbi:hypothetical protein Pfo_016482 [Paulownia fortunei]|nr:hypothetical protein Pfo_016482 [Paulownia fortunei]
MPGLDPKVAVHHLSIKKRACPLVPLIEAEVNILIKVGFIQEVKYSTWISSIVPVRKKNDLNDACPKDNFSLPIIELMIDATTGHEALSFMDGSSGYNQIRMAPKDEELMVFRTPKGIYCYKVMPFRLKNAGATYQMAMQKIFDDMLHKNIECYVDDVVIKSKKREDHLLDLRKVLERLRRYQLKMNLLKCAFGVKSGKFIGFIVRHRAIEIEQAKVDAILKMPEPQDIHELKSLQGKLAYLQRFILNLAGIPFEWDKSCRNALESINTYLMKPPVLVAPVPGHPLILYIAAQECSICLALIFTIQKLNHYFQAHTVCLISKENLLKYLFDDLPDEDVLVIEITPPWKMYFDGASHKKELVQESYSLHLMEKSLIFGLEMAVDIKQLHLKVIDNKQADALANLTSTLAMPEGEACVPICRSWVVPPIFEDENCDEDEKNHVVEVFEVEKEDWRQPLVDYLNYEKLPDDPCQRVDIRRRAARFIHYKSTLYRRSFDVVFLRCLGDDEAIQAIEEAYFGIFGAHQSGPKLHLRIKMMGYYWLTMVKNCMDYAQKCQACQFYTNLIHQPPEPLHPIVASWPFDAWGLDVVGPMTKSSGVHLYILAATDYFSKWAEAIHLKEVKKENVSDFICINIIYRYGIPRYIITDNRNFKQKKSSMYYAVANGLAEGFNKTLCTLLKKVTTKEALWAYRTTFRTPTQAIPYALVYGVEAIVPLEQQIPSLRIAIQEGLTEEENACLRLEELEALDGKRLEAQQRLECYQARMSRAFNKKVRSCSFQVVDLVLAVRRPIITTHRTENKFTSKWDGSYVVKEVYTNGTYKLVAKDGLRISPINGNFLKCYYA